VRRHGQLWSFGRVAVAMGLGPLRPGGLYCSSRLARLTFFFNISRFLQLFTLIPTYKIYKGYFKNSKNFQTLHARRIIQKEQISFWEEVQIPNRHRTKNSGTQLHVNLV
jgi:hypothetical protein